MQCARPRELAVAIFGLWQSLNEQPFWVVQDLMLDPAQDSDHNSPSATRRSQVLTYRGAAGNGRASLSGGDGRARRNTECGVRRVMVQLAWVWLQYQPDSALSQWYQQRFGGGGKRLRRIGIVALARKLLIALWRS